MHCSHNHLASITYVQIYWLFAGDSFHRHSIRIGQTRPQLDSRYEQFIAYDDPVIALTNAKVIDGSGREAQENQTIIIEGDKNSCYRGKPGIPPFQKEPVQ